MARLDANELNAERTANARVNLLSAVDGIAKYHQREVADVIEIMDSPPELFARWYSAYTKREWLLSTYSAQQREALMRFDELLAASIAKYNRLSPLHKFFGSQAGKTISAAASDLALVLRSDSASSD